MSNKKKVGILSMQRIFNYGSFLQAYGLKSILEELDCNVEFVDYHPGECLVPADGGHGIMRKVSKVAEVFRYNAPFKEKIKFIIYKKNYSRNYYPLLGINDTMNYSPEVDVLVIGSDEVFNCVQNNTNVGFTPELFGQNSKAGKVISYAASFGNTTMEKLEKYNVKEKIAQWLKSFSAVSVRDNNSASIVEKLYGTEFSCNLDPVLMYDFMGKCSSIPKKVNESGYLILYGYSGRFTKEECAQIRKYADSKNLKIFCIGGVQDCCDKFIDCSPFEVLAYFKNADSVITDTFHGTIMSVITKRRFGTFIRTSGYGNSEKLVDLIGKLQLKDRIVPDMTKIADVVDRDIDYTQTESIIVSEREKTYQYLKKNIFEEN